MSIALITGASRGLGYAIAHQFAAAGYSLFITSRQEVALQLSANKLKLAFPNCQINAYAADLSTVTGCQLLAEQVQLQGIVPDVLVNNAGVFTPGAVHNEADGNLQHMLQTNLFSAYHLTRLVLPGMIKRKSGHIFNMCSIASLAAYANGGAYSISKYALHGFSANLRQEMMPYHIKVTAVFPGATYTDSWAGSGVAPERIMEAEDIAKMIVAAAALSPQACVEEIRLRPLLGDL